MKIKDIKYPLCYEVDNIPVILELEGEEVVGKSANGMPYPIGKTFVTGYKITREEYVKMAKKLYGEKFCRSKSAYYKVHNISSNFEVSSKVVEWR